MYKLEGLGLLSTCTCVCVRVMGEVFLCACVYSAAAVLGNSSDNTIIANNNSNSCSASASTGVPGLYWITAANRS